MNNKENCGNCKYWNHEEVPTGEDDIGYCKRFPPVIVEHENSKAEKSTYDSAIYWGFPVTYQDQWCGEHSNGKSKKGTSGEV